ncbi:MAG TPA: DUF4396 domain-containing protein [Burkholderiales bacterium]|nr:DUF4396 domain-containing protein [Burkholderiales bacterium]
MIPVWLHALSQAMLALAIVCALIIVADEIRHPQAMWIMNIVWPVTALFGTIIWLWAYFRYGRAAIRSVRRKRHDNEASTPHKPFVISVGEGASHCGSGCTLGDLCAEWLAFFVPAIASWFGWRSIFAEKMYAVWILDYLFAYLFGILFQYFTIVPMRGLSVRRGIVAAIKADTLSLTAWQAGMYGFMAFASLIIFRSIIGTELKVDSVEFWFMMQIAMLAGFVTSYPVNWWLIRAGLKEAM